MNILFPVFKSTDEYISIGYIPRIGLLGQRVCLYSVLVVTLEKQFSKVFISAYIHCGCSTFLPTSGVFSFCFCFQFAILVG